MKLLIVVLLFFGSIANAAIANAKPGTRAAVLYQFVLGVPPISTPAPNIAKASNGDTVEVLGKGFVRTPSGWVSGEGTFVHKNSAGAVQAKGTWQAKKLLAFQSYGNDPGHFPEAYEGGVAYVLVGIMPEGAPPATKINAVMRVNCLIGKPPAGSKEGIRVDVLGLINFDAEVSGETLFIKQD